MWVPSSLPSSPARAPQTAKANMSYDPSIHHRRSIRLKGYDYSAIGSYFITICVQERQCVFGEVLNQVMHLNDAGRMVEEWWSELARKFRRIRPDEHIVMPNHFHGIVTIVEMAPVGAPLRGCPPSPNRARAPVRANVGGHHRLVQDDDDQSLHSRREATPVAAIRGPVVAAELF